MEEAKGCGPCPEKVSKFVATLVLATLAHSFKTGTQAIASTYALESQSFVLHSTAVISEAGIELMKTETGSIMNTPGGGSSAVFAPDGAKISTDIPETEEGLVYCTLDMNLILESKAFLDVCGHYSRPDLLWLGVDRNEKSHIRG